MSEDAHNIAIGPENKQGIVFGSVWFDGEQFVFRSEVKGHREYGSITWNIELKSFNLFDGEEVPVQDYRLHYLIPLVEKWVYDPENYDQIISKLQS